MNAVVANGESRKTESPPRRRTAGARSRAMRMPNRRTILPVAARWNTRDKTRMARKNVPRKDVREAAPGMASLTTILNW